MTNETTPQKKPLARQTKAFALAMVLAGIGLLVSTFDRESFLVSAGLLAGLICFIIGIVWAITDRNK